MALTGRVGIVTIKDGARQENIRRFSKVSLRLTKNNSKLTITVPPDNQTVCELDLRNYSYVLESSTPGHVECVRHKTDQQTLVFIDSTKESTELLTYMREYLSNSPPQHHSEDLAPTNHENVDRFLTALNNKNADEAARIARALANAKTSIRFGLDVINDTGNAPPAPPAPPVVEPLRLQLSIESYLVTQNTHEQFSIAILPGTTIAELKDKIQRDVGIDAAQQYWYINRDHLPDAYTFGKSKPSVNETTMLILYMAKPQNT